MKFLLLLISLFFTYDYINAQTGFYTYPELTGNSHLNSYSSTRKIDDNYLLVEQTANGRIYYSLVDIEQDKVISLWKDPESGELLTRKNCNAEFNQRDILIYNHTVYYTAKSEDDAHLYMIEYDLNTNTMTKSIIEIGLDCRSLYIFSNEGIIYLAFYTTDFELYKKDRDELHFLLRTSNRFIANPSRISKDAEPVLHQGKLFFANHHQFRAYDLNAEKLDTLLEFNTSVDDYLIQTVFAQQIVYNNELYFVYKDLQYQNVPTLPSIPVKYLKANIYKSDGTVAGTRHFDEITTPEPTDGLSHSSMTSLKVFNGNLYWLGSSNQLFKFPVYKYTSGSRTQIDLFDFSKNMHNKNVSLTIGNGMFQHRGKDMLPFYSSCYTADGKVQVHNGHVWTIQDDKIQYIVREAIIDTGFYYESEGIRFMKRNYGNFFFSYNDELHFLRAKAETWGDSPEQLNVNGLLELFKWNENTPEKVSELRHAIKDVEDIFPIQTNLSNDYLFTTFLNTETNLYELWRYSTAVPTTVVNKVQSAISLLIYPNPASGSITIQSPEFLDGQLSIVGVDGKIHQTLRMNGHQKQIDVSKFSNGIYVAIYQVGKDVVYERFVIQR